MAFKESLEHKTAFLREGTCTEHIHSSLMCGLISLSEFSGMAKMQGYYVTGVAQHEGETCLWVGKDSDDIFEYTSFLLPCPVTTHFGKK